MRKGRSHYMGTSFRDRGRIAGSGILYDRYDDEAILESHIRTGTPIKIAEREEEAKKSHESYPVITYKLEKEQPPFSVYNFFHRLLPEPCSRSAIPYGGSVITASTFGSVGKMSMQSPRYSVASPITTFSLISNLRYHHFHPAALLHTAPHDPEVIDLAIVQPYPC